MGCTGSREGHIDEEDKLCRWENELRFQDFSTLQGHYAISRFTNSNSINSISFQQIAEILSLRVKNTHKNPAVEGYFNSFKREDGSYNAHDFKVINVMLSTGVALEKAPVLFEVFDEGFEYSLSRVTIQQMIKEVIYNTTVRAIEAVPASERPVIEAYLQRIRENEGEAETIMLQIACGEEEIVTKEQFVGNLTRVEGAKFLSSTGIRRFLADIQPKMQSNEAVET